MKNVLLLGDSIRMLYQPKVKEALKGRANVYGPVENGRWSDYTLNSLRFWLPQLPDPDIVHFNNGIWDMGDNYQEGRPQTFLEKYEEDMGRMVRVLRQLISPEVKLIVALTTPYLTSPFSEIERYNDALLRIAQRESLSVSDLYTPIRANVEAYIAPDKIHLTPAGAELAAQCAVQAIEPYL